MPARPDIGGWHSLRATGPTRICFLSLLMNAIEGFSAQLNGLRLSGHPAKKRSRQRQQTPGGIHSISDLKMVAPDRTARV